MLAQVGDFLVSLLNEGAVGGSAGALYAVFDVCAYLLCFACLLIHKTGGKKNPLYGISHLL